MGERREEENYLEEEGEVEKICEEMEERRMGEACMKEGEGKKEEMEEG